MELTFLSEEVTESGNNLLASDVQSVFKFDISDRLRSFIKDLSVLRSRISAAAHFIFIFYFIIITL